MYHFKPEKLEAFKKDKKAFCKKHGLHKEWSLIENTENPYIRCIPCHASINKKSFKKRKTINPLKILVSASRGSKKGKELGFNLTEEFLDLMIIAQNYKCALSGLPFIFGHPFYHVSVDRIDSSKGYLQDNVQLVCVIVNKMKLNYNQREFIDICKAIAKNNEKVFR